MGANRIGEALPGAAGRMLALEATFAQAKDYGVTRLQAGEDVWALTLWNGNAQALTRAMREIHERVAPGGTTAGQADGVLADHEREREQGPANEKNGSNDAAKDCCCNEQCRYQQEIACGVAKQRMNGQANQNRYHR